jgi:hypothetical protein
VREKVAPLQTPITPVSGRFPKGGARSYQLDVSAPAGVSAAAVNDLFARAQYQDVSDDAKLTGASFEPLPAGVTLTPTQADNAAQTGVIATGLTYETLDITSFDTPATPTGGKMPRRK